MTEAAGNSSLVENSAPASRDLNSAIAACFSQETLTPPFEERLIELTAALTNQRNVAVWARAEPDAQPESIAQSASAQIGEAERALAAEILTQSADKSSTVIAGSDGYLSATIALPKWRMAALLVAMPANGAMARSLVYERLTLLANLSFAQFRHSDLVNQSEMIKTVSNLAQGDLTKLQSLADALASLTGAEYAATGYCTAGSVSDVAISGQTGPAKRAQLPSQLKSSMKDMVAKNVVRSDRMFASANGSDGLAMIVHNGARNTGMLQIAGSIFQQSQTSKPKSRWTIARFAKLAVVGLVLTTIALIPIPEGIDIPARVEATERRVVTSPLSAPISKIHVTDNQTVVAQETVLITLETGTFDLEIIAANAERATAVLEREAARANRNAALLRNAELEVQRIDARIKLLELQRDSSEIIAPISGIIALQDLEQRVGSFVRQGDTLMEIADPVQMHLTIAVVESKISKLDENASGVFRPDFDPTLKLPAKVSSISPSIDNNEEVPVINGRASFDDAPTALRPGLSGVFAVTQNHKPIGLVIYHAIRDWVLLRIWI